MEPRIWLIAGPTASGKSALALRLAQQLGGEIINADSMQLYQDLRILTARPTPEEEAEVPHHLFGVADAADGWSVGRWLRAAQDVLADLAVRGKPAIIVGGTGLYFAALTRGLADMPEVPADVRARVTADYDADGEAQFRARLAAVDPTAEAAIAPGDRQRLIRALEIFAASGVSLTDWRAETAPALAPGSWRAAVLDVPREELYRRCDARLGKMLEAGALDEVRALMARGLAPLLPAMKAVGVRPFGQHLAGEIPLAAALKQARQDTRNYAKRQLTWLRNQTPDWPRITGTDNEDQWRQMKALAKRGNPTDAQP